MAKNACLLSQCIVEPAGLLRIVKGFVGGAGCDREKSISFIFESYIGKCSHYLHIHSEHQLTQLQTFPLLLSVLSGKLAVGKKTQLSC